MKVALDVAKRKYDRIDTLNVCEIFKSVSRLINCVILWYTQITTNL